MVSMVKWTLGYFFNRRILEPRKLAIQFGKGFLVVITMALLPGFHDRIFGIDPHGKIHIGFFGILKQSGPLGLGVDDVPVLEVAEVGLIESSFPLLVRCVWCK